jgi:hypothetical protein
VDGILEEMFKEVEVDEVELVDAGALHAEVNHRRAEEGLVIVLVVPSIELVVRFALGMLLLVVERLEASEIRTPLLLGRIVATARALEARKLTATVHARRVVRPPTHLLLSLDLAGGEILTSPLTHIIVGVNSSSRVVSRVIELLVVWSTLALAPHRMTAL